MKTENQTFMLIAGEFSPADASTILFELINRKINFHNVESLSLEIKHGIKSNQSEKRIEELLNTKNEIQKLILKAEKDNSNLKIDCKINIDLIALL